MIDTKLVRRAKGIPGFAEAYLTPATLNQIYNLSYSVCFINLSYFILLA